MRKREKIGLMVCVLLSILYTIGASSLAHSRSEFSFVDGGGRYYRRCSQR